MVAITNSHCAETDPLYQGKATILNESHEKRNEAIAAALRQVLGKLLSNTDRANLELIHQITKNAPQYVQQYRFETRRSTESDKKRLFPKTILVNFDPFALNNTLQAKGLKIWNKTRPETLVWLVINERNRVNLFVAEIMPTLAHKIQNAAEKRGLPILFPLMDLTDRQQITVDNISAGISEKILLASQRYGVKHILVGNLSKARKQRWKATWQLFNEQEVSKWNDDNSRPVVQTLDLAFDRVFEDLIAATTKTISIDSDDNSAVTVAITGINNLKDTKQVSERLKSLPGISSVEWQGMDAKVVKFRLVPLGNRNNLEESLSTLSWLEKAPTRDTKDVLNYRFIKDSVNP